MQDASPPPRDPHDAGHRHWLYGLNVTFLVAIGLIVIGFLFFFASRSKGNTWANYDWTSSGVNSLSGSTKHLLTEISDRSQSYKIFSLFPSRNDVEKRENLNPAQDEHRQEVLDLLREYARNSNHITVEDYGDRPTEEVQRQIRDLYQKELKPYQDAISEFDPLAKKLSEFISDQAGKIGVAAQQAGSVPKDAQIAASIQSAFQELPDQIDDLKRVLKKARSVTLPRWGTIKQGLVSGLTEGDLVSILGTLSDKEKVKTLPASLATYFTTHNDEYKAMFDEVNAYKDKLSKLPPLKVDDLLESLQRNTVAILGSDSAKVINEYELFTSAPNQNGGSSPVTFNGEQAISFALFAMVRPEKVKVVFIGANGRGGSTFNDIKDLLRAENFDPLDWSPPGPQMPGAPPPDSGPPPAEGRGVVWIVFPPEVDPQMAQMGMSMPPNPQPIIDATRKHMEAGGQVLFLAEATAANPMMGGSAGYPYEELIHDLGINVQSKYTILARTESEDPNTGVRTVQALPYIQLNRYEDNEITRPMQSYQAVFGPARSPSFCTVVGLVSPLPAGIEGKVLVKTPANSDYWGSAAGFSQTATFNKDTDLSAASDGIPIAAIAIKNKGQKDKDGKSLEQRVAVFGSKDFASDFFLDFMERARMGGQDVVALRFPGNQELFKNTVLWLAGYENMIAVSAKANQAPRIGDVSPVKLAFIRTIIAGGIPAAALILGGIIWMMRRR